MIGPNLLKTMREGAHRNFLAAVARGETPECAHCAARVSAETPSLAYTPARGIGPLWVGGRFYCNEREHHAANYPQCGPFRGCATA